MKRIKILAIVQARVSSTRLPFKVLKKINDKPALYWVLKRLTYVPSINNIVLATSNLEEDAVLENIAKEVGVKFFVGSLDDVLDRYYKAAKIFSGDIIVRITGDCPLVDPKVTESIISFMLKNVDMYDYVSNTIKPTFPDGLDTEVFTFSAIEKAWKEAKLSSEREHVTPYIYKHPEEFKLFNFEGEDDYSGYRWVLDNQEDLELISKIYEFFKDKDIFYMDDILDLFRKKPELKEINAHINRNEGYSKTLKNDMKKLLEI